MSPESSGIDNEDCEIERLATTVLDLSLKMSHVLSRLRLLFLCFPCSLCSPPFLLPPCVCMCEWVCSWAQSPLLAPGASSTQQFAQFLEDERKDYVMAFLVDKTSHLNDLNLKLQGKNNSVCDFVAAVQSLQRKSEIFKVDLQEKYTHFPAMKPIQGETLHMGG